jgi:hypothetical protein
MRRNLTLEETGVLDLRKFQAPDQYTFRIPFDWLLLQGINPNNLSAGNTIASFLKAKFSIFIIGSGEDYGTPDYASTVLNSGEDSSEVATFIPGGDYIYVDAVSSDEKVVELAI